MTRRAIGADGCPAGWVVVVLEDGRTARVAVADDLGSVLGAPHDAAGVDMPIGLLDVPRDADVAARRLLPGRASSVFSAPPRCVVDAWRDGRVTTHAGASALAVEVTGKGMSQQAWRLVAKVAAVDDLVRSGAELSEVHPEVAFAVVAGDPLPRKRSWAGLHARRTLLGELGIELPDRFPGDTAAAPDDVVDAAICAWVADGEAQGETLVTVPPETRQTVGGLPVVISARRAPDAEVARPRPAAPEPRRPRP